MITNACLKQGSEGESISIVLDNQNFPEVHFLPFNFADLLILEFNWFEG
jgi:hypothetical protein